MSGRFNTRSNKSSSHKFIWIALCGIVFIGLGALYLLQPKPPESKQVSEEVTLSIDNGALSDNSQPAPVSASSSALPVLPAVKPQTP